MNGTASSEIKIDINYSDYPLIISCKNNIVLVAGDDYYDFQICEITGEKLKYSSKPGILCYILDLPSHLYIDKYTGKINGYSTEWLNNFIDIELNVFNNISSVTFIFHLLIELEPYPNVVESTIKDSITIISGVVIVPFYPFVAVGKDLLITVFPGIIIIIIDLPENVFLDKNTGLIYGESITAIPPTLYSFEISQPNVTQTINIDILITFIAIYCPENRKFPVTIGTITGNKVYISCGAELEGQKSRICYYDIVTNISYWGDVNDSECKLLIGGVFGIITSCITGFIIVISFIIYISMRCYYKKENTEISSFHLKETLI